MEQEIPLLSIQKHCAELTGYYATLNSFRGYEGTETVASWLSLAACIESINYDTTIFDTGGGVCGYADLWAEMQGNYQKKLVKEILRFQFCWNALESFINLLIIPDFNLERGKINNACAYLKRHYPTEINICSYDKVLEELQTLSNNNTIYNSLRNADSREFLSKEGKGIYRVYSLRNLLAHGAFDIPIVETNEQTTPDLELVKASIRIVLLTLQMLSICKYGSHGLEIFLDKKGTILVDTSDYLKNIHLPNGIDNCKYSLA